MSSGSGVVESAAGRGWGDAVIRDRLTVERSGSYLAATGQDLERAFQLYEWNIRASAGVLTTTAMVEVVVRNALDEQLRGWVGRRRGGGRGSMRRPWMSVAVRMWRGLGSGRRGGGAMSRCTAR